MADSERRLRVVTLVENTSYIPSARVRPHAEALAAAGYQVTVISPRAPHEPARETVNGVTLYRFPMPIKGTGALTHLVEFALSTIAGVVLTLWVWARRGLDVLHIYAPPDSIMCAGLLPRLAGRAVVYDLRDLSPELYRSHFGRTSPLLHRLLLLMERACCQLAQEVIVVNESYRRVVMERDGVSPERVSVVRYGPDLEAVYPTAEELDIRAGAQTVIGYLGKMARQDGVDHLLRALGHLDATLGYRDWRCVLVGSADDLEGLKEQAAELGIADRVLFTGFLPRERWIRVLSTADICAEPAPANPLNDVSTMIKLMDYMSLAKPTVAFDLPESRVTAGEAALYARPNDELHFARQIARLIDDPELRARLGSTGRERMEQGLAWPYQRARLLALYARLAEATGR